ncbi:MAG: DUF349 domain-containing protein [Flavobacteriaceae bacterium]|nr:DUF349 domain-containing protein [Mangrovimonas sp.]MCB0438283.1 DUF349 domain-containing protein [Mangrovimonas sp.]
MSETDNLQEADGQEEMKKAIESEKEAENNVIEDTANNEKLPDTEDDGLDEIDESNAEDAEDEGNSDRHKIEFKDYENMSLEMLAIELEKLLQSEKVQAIKKHVDAIKNEFNDKFDSLVDEKKEEFLAEGGNEIDFYYSNPIKKRFNNTYREYRNKLNAHYKSIQENLKKNLDERLEIIEEIKGLINVEENINTTYKHFKELQERWRHAGPIPRDKYNNAWNSYHHHVEIFYDFLHLNRELRDLDFKHNYEQKLKIIERAEELAQEEDTNHAFRELQVLHKLWKEELGPVAKEHREEIWGRFKKATKTIHDKRQEYFKNLDSIYEENLEKKQDIIDKINAIANEEGSSHGFWQKKIKEIEALREDFFSAGKVPIKVNEATWSKFKESVRNFNRKKNAFYKDLKKEQLSNLQKKLDLIKIAEDNKDNDDFATTTPLMKKIQNDWKTIGHVPRKDSDKIWKQFKNACNHYFDKLHASLNAANKEGLEAYNKKNELLEEIKSIDFTKKKDKGVAIVNDYISKWNAAGKVPSNKRYIEGKFNKVLDGIFKTLDVDTTEAELMKFETKLEDLSNDDDIRHLQNEKTFIRKKIDEMKSEINQLENNLQFFTNVDEDNPVVKEVLNNIENHKESLKVWKMKLSKLRELDQ